MPDTSALSDPRLAGVPHRVVTHELAGSAEEAAELRGVPISALIKTIVVRRAERDYVFVLVPGDRVIDWPKLRSFLGERRLSMPGPDEAFEATGYVRGTITPLGASQRWPVLMDVTLENGDVSIGGGARGVSITIDGSILIELLDGQVGDLTKPQ